MQSETNLGISSLGFQPPKTDPVRVRPEVNNWLLMLSETPDANDPTITQTPWFLWQEASAVACYKAVQNRRGIKLLHQSFTHVLLHLTA